MKKSNNRDTYLHFCILCLLSIAVCSCKQDSHRSIIEESIALDSVAYWIQTSKDDDVKKDLRLGFLNKAKSELLLAENDSIKIKKLYEITDRYYSFGEDSLFLLTNEEAFRIAKKSNDSKAIAEYHWNKGAILSDHDVLDSAYYHYNRAHELYSSINHDYYKAKMAYNMSFIQFRVNNYVESEILVISAIDGFKKLNRDFNLLLCYNRLLLLDKEMGNLNGALSHYNIASKYLEKIDSKGVYREKLLNNLSLVYQKQEKYLQAIETLDKALSNRTLKIKHANLYAKLVDNRAYNRFLNGEVQGVYHDFNSALNIRDSLGNEAGIGISNMHLAEYNLFNGDTLKAFAHAKQANDIALKLGLNRDILNSLAILSRANPGQATVYLNQYKSLNDSLLLEERKVRDKFTRIQFETEGYIDANKDLKKKNVWISLTSMLALASISLLFFVYRQKSKNRSLVLEQKQQKANEEIYDLMLKQQNREEEGRIQERVRISEELHDGVLARLFSVRISLGFLKVRGNNKEEDKFDLYKKELQIVEKEIRTLSHALKNDELSSKKDFPKLLSELLEEQSVIGDFTYVLEEDSAIAWNLVDEKLKINLYRIVQEAICNIIKYADCNKVEVSLSRKNKKVELVIVDDGKGFDTNIKNKGIGLKNMSSRAKSIGACNSISSSLDKGTKIIVSIPTKILYHGAKTQSIDY